MASATVEGNLMGGGWAELLPDLLTLIAKRVHRYEDFVSFGGVCRSWRSVAVKENFNSSSRVQVPWLMLAKQAGDGNDHRRFASLSKGRKVHRVYLPEARRKQCISSMGWLITTDAQGNMELLHPLSRLRIHLPRPSPAASGELEWLHKRAVLSASPSFTNDYVVMVTFALQLYFWKPGNKVWSHVSLSGGYCCDVIYYKDQFYAIDTNLKLFLCDTNSGESLAVGHVTSHDMFLRKEEKVFLVESAGELLVVRVGFCYVSNKTRTFRVYKYDSADTNKWREINHLGGSSIFVGRSAATAVPAAAEIKPNCIYFTESYRFGCVSSFNPQGPPDLGIYNLETQTIEPLPKVSRPLDQYFSHIWVIPSF